MQKNKNKRITILVSASALALFLFSILIMNAVTNKNKKDLSESEVSNPGAMTSTDIAAYSNDDEITTVVLSTDLMEMDYDYLSTKSMLVIRGKVVDQSNAFQVIPVYDGAPRNFTDYYLEVSDVLRGDADIKQIITVRVQGGLVNTLNFIAEEAPKFKVGDAVFVFLYQPNMGSAYNTKGDYYYVLGENQGVFSLDNSAASKNTDLFKNEYGISLEWDQAVSSFEDLNKTNPVDKDWVYNEFLENQKRNLDTGFITQEEYDMFLAEAQRYATIVN